MGANHVPKLAPCELLRHLPPTDRCAFRRTQAGHTMVPARPFMAYLDINTWDPIESPHELEGTRFAEVNRNSSTVARRLSDARKSGAISERVIDEVLTSFGDAYLLTQLWPVDEFPQQPTKRLTDVDLAILRSKALERDEGVLAAEVADEFGWPRRSIGTRMLRLVRLRLLLTRPVPGSRVDGYVLTDLGRHGCATGRIPLDVPLGA